MFSSYFVNVIADNKIEGTSLWGWTIALSGFFVAIIGPLFGQLADYNKLEKIAKKYNLFLIEDACQSFGATYNGKKSW